MHLSDILYSDNGSIFYLAVLYNPLQVGMHDQFSVISHLVFESHCRLNTNSGFSS